MEREILYIWLNKVRGIGPVLATNLINYFSDIYKIYIAKEEELLKVEGIGKKLAKEIYENKNLYKSMKILEKCKKLNIKVLTRESKNYPQQLRNNPRAPLVLYVRGELKLFDNGVAIVGSRRCTEYGKEITIELSKALSNQQLPIISGMAKGIDSYAHTVALNNNNYTLAVLGTGVDICYPSEHVTLMEKIIQNGAVVSQFEPGSTNQKVNFIKRNELIAMLSDKIVVVEASKESGSLYTAHCGIKYNKDVYAVPGSIKSKCSEGTNILIKEGIKPYLSIKDIVKTSEVKTTREFGTEEKMVISLLNKKGTTIDFIRSETGLELCILEELLFEMEANGSIKQAGGILTLAT